MSSLDTETVWQKLAQDPKFTTGVPEHAYGVFREVVGALPTILEGQLEVKVTLSTIAKAKLAIVEHMLANGFVGKLVHLLVATLPADQREAAAVEMSAFLKDIYYMQRMPLIEMVHNLAGFLESSGVTERMFLSNPEHGLNEANLEAYDQGRLTIAALMETQPAIFLAGGAE